MSSQRTTWSSLRQFFNLPLSTQQSTALLRAPRAVPDVVLRFTDPQGPMPIVVKIPSRDQGRHIPVYLWVPPSNGESSEVSAASPRKVPINLDFHGGGFVMGSCLEQAPFCSKLAREANVISVSVDYRLGPLDKFPAAVHDAEDVLSAILHQEAPGYATLRQAVAKQAQKLGHASPFEPDPTRVSLSGFSSGGNLALNLLLSIEDWPSPFASSIHDAEHIPALLFFPSFDSRQLPHERPRPEGMGPHKPSFFGDALAKTMDGSYLPAEMRSHPRASPGLAALRAEEDDDKATGLHERTRALLVLPELDNLAHQSAEWLKAVEEAGRSEAVKVRHVPGATHGWTQMPESFLSAELQKSKEEVMDEAVKFILEHWGEDNGNKEAERVTIIPSST